MPQFQEPQRQVIPDKDETLENNSSLNEEQVSERNLESGGPATAQRWLGLLQSKPDTASRHAVFRSLQSSLGNRFSTTIARLYNQAQSVIQRVRIAGYTLSWHGTERGEERGVSNGEIRSAIQNGNQYNDSETGGLVFYEGDVAVITMGNTIVTVYRTFRPNRPKARWVPV